MMSKTNNSKSLSIKLLIGLSSGCVLFLIVCALGIAVSYLVSQDSSTVGTTAKQGTPNSIITRTFPTITPVSPEKSISIESKTDIRGEARFFDSLSQVEVPVLVRDNKTQAALPEIQMYFVSNGSRFLIVATDSTRKYLTTWFEGAYSDFGIYASPKRNFIPSLSPSKVYAYPPLAAFLLLMKAYSVITASADFIDLVKNPPYVYDKGFLYEDRCWTGKQLAELASVGLVLIPGVEKVIPVDDELTKLMVDFFRAMQEVAGEGVKEKISQFPHLARIRVYKLGPNILAVVPVGFCPDPSPPTPTSLPNPTWVSRELYQQLQTLIIRANASQREALRTLNPSVMAQDSTGAELQRNIDWINELRNKGLYIVATQERLTFLSFKQLDTTHVDIEAFEVWSNQVYSSNGQLLYSGPPCDLPQTYHLEKFNDRWLITKIDFHNQCFYEP